MDYCARRGGADRSSSIGIRAGKGWAVAPVGIGHRAEGVRVRGGEEGGQRQQNLQSRIQKGEKYLCSDIIMVFGEKKNEHRQQLGDEEKWGSDDQR